MSEAYSLYIMCKSREAGEARKRLFTEFGIRSPIIYVGDNHYRFINDVIRDCPNNVALICDDDVILAANIDAQVNACLYKADAEFGGDRWAFIGNTGVNAINHQVMRFRHNGCESPLPWNTARPYPSAHLDGKALLVQVRNCRDRGFAMPEHVTAHMLYDLVLVIESYRCGLVCGVDSSLFTVHDSCHDMKVLSESMKDPTFIGYAAERFSNYRFITSYGPVEIEMGNDYLANSKTDGRPEVYSDCIMPVISNVYSDNPQKKLTVATITDGRNLNSIRRLLDTIRVACPVVPPVIDLEVVLLLKGEGSAACICHDTVVSEYGDLPVRVIKNAAHGRKGYELTEAYAILADDYGDSAENYLWYIDESDFIMPSIISLLPVVLHADSVTAFDVQVFEELWDGNECSVPSQVRRRERVKSSTYFNWVMGGAVLPKSALIVPLRLIRDYLYSRDDMDCRSNLAMCMHFACNVVVDTVPMVAAGIGLHPLPDSINDFGCDEMRFRQAMLLYNLQKNGNINKIHHDYFQYWNDKLIVIEESLPYRLIMKIRKSKLMTSLYSRLKPFIVWLMRDYSR